MRLKTIEDLRKEFPKEKYFYVESEKSIFPKLFGSCSDGNFELWIGSPATKGAKQPLIYFNNTKSFLSSEKEIIKAIEEIISNNKFINDTNWRERGEQNQRLKKALKIIKGEEV